MTIPTDPAARAHALDLVALACADAARDTLYDPSPRRATDDADAEIYAAVYTCAWHAWARAREERARRDAIWPMENTCPRVLNVGRELPAA